VRTGRRPTTGLDPQSRSNLWEHIRRLREDLGTTVFLTTHYLDEADALCDRILVIDYGRIVAEGTPEELKRRISGWPSCPGRVLRDVVTLLVQGIVLVLAGVAFGMRAPVGGVLVGLGFIAVVAISLSAISYTVGLLTKSEDVLAPAINMVVVPLMLLSGIMLPMTLGPGWLQDIARATPFRYIIDAMRGAFAGQYLTTIMLEGVLVAIGLAAACLWIAGRAFVRENA
jgi:hypothetical protein